VLLFLSTPAANVWEAGAVCGKVCVRGCALGPAVATGAAAAVAAGATSGIQAATRGQSPTPTSTFLLTANAQEYLERYYMLIAFAGYLSSSQFDPGTDAHTPFPTWMAERPELRR